ncbi:beta-ketoacyl-ACP synthase III [Streptomyces sp. NPDC001678]|uniref:beta-ketoacyl-ACP synthase III n=1 Tax=Streptomyces sp. NPDC001678 TaxID=3364599 RepID=UPI0036A22E75
MPAYISGVGIFLPNEPVGNDEIENVLGQVGGRRSRTKATVLQSNGITSRHYALDPASGEMTHTNCQLTVEAIRALCDRTGFSLADLDTLSCGTSLPDQALPNHAVMVHGELGCPPCEPVSTAGVCMSGLTAFKYAYLSVLSGNSRNAVSTASELASASLRSAYFESGYKPADSDDERATERLRANPVVALEADFLRWMLSDGSAAVLVTDEPRGASVSLRVDWVEIISMAHLADPCMYAGAVKHKDGSFVGWRQAGSPRAALEGEYFYIRQDARQLGQLITKLLGESIDVLRERRDVTGDDYDWFLPHYSSAYFRQPFEETFRERGLGIPSEKWFTNLASKGNTGSASVFIMLEELLNGGRLTPGQKLLCWVPESGRFTYGFMQLTVV